MFQLGGQAYGLAIDQIKEVVHRPPVAKMPQTPAYIKGLANIRGNIIAIMDLEQKFGLQEKGATADDFEYTLIIENETYKIGVLVQEVPDTITVPVEHIDRASDFVQYSSLDARCLVGVLTHNDQLIILIDIINMVEVEGIETVY